MDAKPSRSRSGLLAALILAATSSADYKLCDPKATPEARALANYLESVWTRKSKSIAGECNAGYAQLISDRTGGKKPALLGYDFNGIVPCQNEKWTGADEAIDWVKNHNGIAQFQWHWVHPDNCSSWSDKWGFAGSIDDPTSAKYKAILANLDLVGAAIRKMQDAKVPILFRPLHEAEGGWFWWGEEDKDAFQALYKLIWNHFVNDLGLHNIVWIYNSYGGDHPNWYLGDAYADIIGYDYPDWGGSTWAKYQNLFGKSGKMFAVAEDGAILGGKNSSVLTQQPWIYFMTWDYMILDLGQQDNQGRKGTQPAGWLKTMYNDPNIITLSDLPPDLYGPHGPIVLAPLADVRVSNSLSTVSGVADLAKVFQDTSKLVYSVAVAGSTTIAAKLNGTRVDLAVAAGDTGTATVTATATNAQKLSASTSFKVFLKDYHAGNLALHQPSLASSSDPDAPDPSAAFDGDAKTRWSSGYTDDEWLQVDLDSSLAIDSVSISWEAAFAKSYRIETSTDSVHWSVAATRDSGVGGIEGLSFTATKARFVRLHGIQRSTKYGYSVWELGVYGPSRPAGIQPSHRSPAGSFATWNSGRSSIDVRATGGFRLELRDLEGRLAGSWAGTGSTMVACRRMHPGLYRIRLTDERGETDGTFPILP